MADNKEFWYAINQEITRAENAGDAETLATLVASELAFRRANGKIEGRKAFLEAAKPSGPRVLEAIDPLLVVDQRAVIRCTICMGEERFDNIRLFIQEGEQWKLLGWANVAQVEATLSTPERAYTTSQLPTLRPSMDPNQHRELLMRVYDQTCQTWRQLVEVRFKLLALVPSLSLAMLAYVLTTDPELKRHHVAVYVVFVVIGMIITFGLWIYDKRNSELYDELISRARKQEEELGLHTGAFLGRPNPKTKWIKHGYATTTVYFAAGIAWTVAGAVTLFG